MPRKQKSHITSTSTVAQPEATNITTNIDDAECIFPVANTTTTTGTAVDVATTLPLVVAADSNSTNTTSNNTDTIQDNVTTTPTPSEPHQTVDGKAAFIDATCILSATKKKKRSISASALTSEYSVVTSIRNTDETKDQNDRRNGEEDDDTDTVIPEEEWLPYVRNATLVHLGLRGDVLDSVLFAYSLCIPVVLSQDDRIGKYKIHSVNQFVGFACPFCHYHPTSQQPQRALPGFGRYFPNSYNSLLNGTNTTSLVQHFMKLCRQCPTNVRNLMTKLYTKDNSARRQRTPTCASAGAATTDAPTATDAAASTTQSSSNSVVNRPRYGSRKRFYTYIWNKLRSIDAKQLIVQQSAEPQLGPQQNTPTKTATSDTANIHIIMGPNNDDSGMTTSENVMIANTSKSSSSSSVLTREQEALFHSTITNSEIVHLQDRFLVSDTTLFTIAQMKICTLEKDDQIGRCKDHSIGFIGLCCAHCSGKAGKPGYGRYFPSSLRSLAQADACQQIVKHMTKKCTMCPLPMKQLLIALSEHDTVNPSQFNALNTNHLQNESSISMDITTNTIERTCDPTTTCATNAALTPSNDPIATTKMNQYGSRRIFFRRVWARLHGAISPEVVESTMLHAQKVAPESMLDTNVLRNENANEATAVEDTLVGDMSETTIPWDRVVGFNNRIVNIDTDRGLISDTQLSAMAQLDICHLTGADKIGWFKDRNIGCVGLCCKHCGGRPSFGRYFPNSVRSLAQTTSSQTIISHIALYCPKCPKDIRDIISKLHRLENSKEASTAPTASNYGSRKVFFNRVWARIHAQPPTNATPMTITWEENTIAIANETETTTKESIADPMSATPPIDTTYLVATTIMDNANSFNRDMEIEGEKETTPSRKRKLDADVQVDEVLLGQSTRNDKGSK